MTKPLVSIIIPVYNAEAFFAATLESCLTQTYKNIEIIIINDGSTDLSEDIIKQFKDERIYYFNKINEGPCMARNFGISKSKGHLVQFLDHDDVIDKNKILHQVEMYYKYGDEYIYSGTMGTVSGEVRTEEKDYELYEKDFNPQEYYSTVLNQFGKYITTGAWLTPKKIINSTYGWDANAGLNDDGEYFMRIILNSKGIVFCNKSIFYFRRDVANSLSKQFTSKDVYEKWLYSYQSYVKNFQRVFDKKIANELGWKALSVFYCNSYPNYADLRKICKSQMLTLGYTTVNPHGGSIFVKVSSLIGTDNALQLFYFRSTSVKIIKAKFFIK